MQSQVEAYAQFLRAKAITDPATGLIGKTFDLPERMFQFQHDVTAWALRRGRAAIFAGTGLGKTIMELAWGREIERETRRPILHFAPLAVSAQIVREANKFGIPARLVASKLDCEPGYICVTNYQKLHHFDVTDFGATILDEAGILKSIDGHYRTELIEHCAPIPFRLEATATPAPNDFMEIGNHAEFLGIMSYTDMLATFFVHDGGDTQKWRLKGHAEDEFWKWMASWAVMLRKPSDLGYSDEGYDLPPLVYHSHVIDVEHDPSATGTLFPVEAKGLSGRLKARRDSIDDRARLAWEVTPSDGSFGWWCHLNDEAQLLAKNIPGAFNLHGGLSDDEKERAILRYLGGDIRVLVSKSSICGFGMNFQHCHRTGFVGLSDSWEQYYQAIRRFWRFGQTEPVDCHIISASTEGPVVANIQRKEAQADRMAANMVAHMSDLSRVEIQGSSRQSASYIPTEKMDLPTWLS